MEINILRRRLLMWVAVISIACVGSAKAQFHMHITDSTPAAENDRIVAISCYGENCTACEGVFYSSSDEWKLLFKRTTNGGQTWELQDPGLPTDYTTNTFFFEAIDQIDSLNVVAVGDTALIVRTFNGGKTWTRQSCPTKSILLDVHFSDSLTGIVVGTRPPVILTTSNGGKQWNEASFGDLIACYSCHSDGEGKFRAFGFAWGPVYSTSDWWATVDSGKSIPDSIPGTNDEPDLRCRFGDGDTIIAFGTLFHVLPDSTYVRWAIATRSTDDGNNWQPFFIDSIFNAFTCVSPIFNDTVIAGTTKRSLMLSTDDGYSWNEDTILFNPNAIINDAIGLSFTSDGSIIGAFAQDYLGDDSYLARGEAVSSSVSIGVNGRIGNLTQVYPNPATNDVNITSADVGQQLSVTDILGREILRGVIPADGPLKLDVSSLQSGLYFVTDGNWRVKFAKE